MYFQQDNRGEELENVSQAKLSSYGYRNATEMCEDKYKPEQTVLMLLGFAMNCTAVAMLVKVKRRNSSRATTLTMLLACNDLFSCTLFLVSVLANSIFCEFKAMLTCDIFGLLATTSYAWSLNIVVVLSVERYLLVFHPMMYHQHCSRTVLVGICVGGLILDFTLGMLPLFGVGKKYMFYEEDRFCTIDFTIKGGGWSQKGIVLAVAINGLVRATIVAFCNVAVSILMRRRSAGIVGTWNSSHGRAMANANAFATLTQVIAFFNVTLTVPFCIRLLVDTMKEKEKLGSLEDRATAFLLFVSPLVNPVLYVTTNKACRQCLLDTLCCRCFGRTARYRNSTSRLSSRTTSHTSSLKIFSPSSSGESSSKSGPTPNEV